MKKTKFKVTGMSCAACSARVERAVSALNGVGVCEVNLLLGEMSVVGDASDEAVIGAVERAGYGASVYNEAESTSADVFDAGRKEIKSILLRLIVSGGLLLVLMYISMGHVMWGFPLPQYLSERPLLLGIAELLLTSLIMVINKHFFVKGAQGIVNLAPNMDTLVALGSSVSYVYSIFLLFRMNSEIRADDILSAHHTLHALYFESAAMILVLITLGKLLESMAKGKTTSAIRALMDLTPKTATVIRDGEELEIPAKDIRLGDIFIVKKGENIACDGRVVEGEISVDESALTGESLPKDVISGGTVFGATAVLSGWAKIEALKVGEETAIAEIIKMVRDASSSKAPVAKAADKIAGIFVPSVLLISLVTFAVWMLLRAPLSEAITHAVTVLVISCPCALGLATPVAIMVGSGLGARKGILFKNATALELAGKLKTVAFDKTGTITEGNPEVSEVVPYGISENDLISIASAIEEKSEHPLASAIVNYSKGVRKEKPLECESFEAFVGGVCGIVEGEKYFIGNERFIKGKTSLQPSADFERLKGEGQTALMVAKSGGVLGIIAISDKIKDDSREAVLALKALGIKTVMITGDNASAARKVAERVAIDEVWAQVLPADKAQIVKTIAKDGTVAMVGDGINDSVALTEADVGIAIGRGADIAIDSADVVLTRGSLMGVVSAVKLGRRVLLNVYENLFWAFSYNIIGIPLAAGAFSKLLGWSLTPMFGAAAMSVSSFLVVMNALRLNLYNPEKIRKNKNKSLQNKENYPKITEFSGNERNNIMNTLTIKIEGMMCPHCSGRVKSALEASELVLAADVSHERGDAVVTLVGAADEKTASALKEIINAAGYNTP